MTAAGGATILVTGATGVLGSEVLARLRRESAATAFGVSSRGDPVLGVHAWRLGSGPPPAELPSRFDTVVHCAATTRWTLSPAEAWAANVDSVSGLLHHLASGTHVVHVSTIFVTGLRVSVESDALADYRNTYEWSKAAAERMVREWSPVSIVRPPLIIGRRGDGAIRRFDGVYTVTKALCTGMAPALVGDADAPFDLAPVDQVAGVVVGLALGPPPTTPVTVDIAPGDGFGVADALAVIYEELDRYRAAHGLPPLPKARLIACARWDRFFYPFCREHLSPRQLRIVDLLANFRPYLERRERQPPAVVVDDPRGALATSLAWWAEQNHARVVGARAIGDGVFERSDDPVPSEHFATGRGG